MWLDWDNLNADKRIFMSVAVSHLGEPYLWGGDDPVGWDCSGLVLECLKSVDRWPENKDATADGIKNSFTVNKFTNKPDTGVIVFFCDDDQRAYHVAICLYPNRIIEAGGGDHTVTTPEIASQKNAYVRVRPFRYDPNHHLLVDPFRSII